ncbi:MAG TPA: hypothetical protein VFZ89_16750, partial [Solirubrobacteraceae bacterium]
RASRDALGRLVYTARQSSGEALPVLDYRGAMGAGATTVASLGDQPLAARDALLAALRGERLPRRLRVAS